MKRFFIFLSLAALCIISANARILQYRFDTESKVNDWVDSYNTSACDCIFDSEYGYLKVTTKSADSYINHNFETAEEYIDASKYSYLHIRFKVLSGSGTEGQVFFSNEEYKMGASGTYTGFSISDSKDWQDVYVNLSPLSKWNGNITALRIDPVQSPTEDMTILIHSATLCTTLEEAYDLTKPIYKFTDYSKLSFMTYSGISNYFNDGYWEMHLYGNDPQVKFSFPVEKQVNAEDYPYIAFRQKAVSDFSTGGIFFSMDGAAYSGTAYKSYTVDKTGEWKDYIIDMSTHPAWTGTLTGLRMDPLNNVDYESVVTLDRIGVFATEDEAEAFLALELDCNVVDEEVYIDTGAPIPMWDMSDSEVSAEFYAGGGFGDYELGVYHLYAVTKDLQISIELDEPFSADEFRYFAVKYRTDSDITSGGIFFTNELVTGFSDKAYSSFGIISDGIWHYSILNLASSKPDIWTGNIDSFRVDILNPSNRGDEVYIAGMGFSELNQRHLNILKALKPSMTILKTQRFLTHISVRMYRIML